jgi:hypothetical protein
MRIDSLSKEEGKSDFYGGGPRIYRMCIQNC